METWWNKDYARHGYDMFDRLCIVMICVAWLNTYTYTVYIYIIIYQFTCKPNDKEQWMHALVGSFAPAYSVERCVAGSSRNMTSPEHWSSRVGLPWLVAFQPGLNGVRAKALWWDYEQQIWEVVLPSKRVARPGSCVICYGITTHYESAGPRHALVLHWSWTSKSLSPAFCTAETLLQEMTYFLHKMSIEEVSTRILRSWGFERLSLRFARPVLCFKWCCMMLGLSNGRVDCLGV